MPRYSSDPIRSDGPIYEPTTRPHARRPSVSPQELASWLRQRVPSLTAAWSRELERRSSSEGSPIDAVVKRFTERMVWMLPLLLGPQRAFVRPLWIRLSELFGVVAAKRGLAAGEVTEEIHVLRELVIRDLYRDPPNGGRVPLSLRDVLRLNRSLDRAVTHASVGHTDAMFFQFFERDEDSPSLSVDAVAEEAMDQLDSVTEELLEVLGTNVTAPADPGPGN